jgi:hypothetical protein
MTSYDSLPMVNGRKPLTIYLSPEEHMELFSLATRLSTSVSRLAHTAVVQMMAAEKEGVRPLLPRVPLKEPFVPTLLRKEPKDD